MGFDKNVLASGKALNAIFIVGFLGIVWLMIYGNLSGNLGFATGSLNYNRTEGVIGNLSSGASTFYGFAPTWFTILAIVLLILILVGLLMVVMKISKMGEGKGGFGSI